MIPENLMSYVGCNLVIPACPESFLRKDSRQAGVTERAFRLFGNDKLRRIFVVRESTVGQLREQLTAEFHNILYSLNNRRVGIVKSCI